MTGFRLFPEAAHWWSLNDYGAVLGVMTRLGAKRVVEFGPGSSTLALIEGGATAIDAYEDDPDWRQVYQERLVCRFPDVLTIHPYVWSDPIVLPAPAHPYDLALIDGPRGTMKRPPVIAWCLAHARHVLVPTEDHIVGNPTLRPTIQRLADESGRTVEWMETGPLSGGFALVAPAC